MWLARKRSLGVDAKSDEITVKYTSDWTSSTELFKKNNNLSYPAGDYAAMKPANGFLVIRLTF